MKKPILRLFSVALLSFAVATTTVSCSSDDGGSTSDDTENPSDDTNDDGGNTSDFVVNRDDLQGTITSGEVILESGTYKLTGKLIVGDGAKLTIKAGVIIEATALGENQYDAVRYIAVSQGGEINVEGEASNPVVMTAENKTPGSWGGLVLCGKAPINKGTSASAEVSDLTYGGAEADDTSGSIKYLRIEYSGYAYNSEKEFNGLSLFGVGSGTTIEYVQVHEGSDDGFEWFGGTVNAKYLIVTNFSEFVGDDLFDWTEGWTGSGENWYGIRTNAGNRGIEADNNSNDEAATPISNPNIKNLTLIGSGVETEGENQAIKLRVGTKGSFDNIVLKDWKTGFDVQAAPDLSAGYVGTELKATNVKFENVGTTATSPAEGIFTESASATGAGNGTATPSWAAGWTVGL